MIAKVLSLLALAFQFAGVLLLLRPAVKARKLFRSEAYRRVDGGDANQNLIDDDSSSVLELFLQEIKNPIWIVSLTLASIALEVVSTIMT